MINAAEERILVKQAAAPSVRPLADTRYNDALTAASATGIDTKGYDEALIVADLGAISSGTLDLTIMDSSLAASAVNATAVTGATFTQLTSSRDSGIYTGRVRTKNTKRYLYIRAVAATADDKAYAVNVLLGKADSLKVTQDNTPDFTV